MDEALRARIKAQIPGAACDWGLSGQAIQPPRIVLWRISGGHDYTTTGRSGLAQARVQIDCYGASVGAAKILARSVKTALSGWRDGDILGVFLDGERDGEPDAGLAEVLGRVSLDFNIHYQET